MEGGKMKRRRYDCSTAIALSQLVLCGTSEGGWLDIFGNLGALTHPLSMCWPCLYVAVKAAVKTQSRRQSGLVCSLLVVSLLLSAAVGGEGEYSLAEYCSVSIYGYTYLSI